MSLDWHTLKTVENAHYGRVKKFLHRFLCKGLVITAFRIRVRRLLDFGFVCKGVDVIR